MKQVFALLVASVLSTSLCVAKPSKTDFSSKDIATADGSLRVGLHNGKVYGVLTGIAPAVELSPDSWSSDDESVSWNRWLVDFDNDLFSNWSDANPGDGQQTVLVRIANGVVTQDNGTFFGTGNSDAQTFANAITSSLQKTLKGASPMPQTKNPLKEIRLALTFMSDPRMVPRYGREQLGFLAVLNAKGDNINVFGRMKEGRAPGIQIVSDRDGGTIQVTEDGPFLQNCRSVDVGN